MGNFIKLKAKDGHSFGAYEAKPAGKPRGGHAFNRFGKQAWYETSAVLARQRTLNFLHEKVG